MRCIKNKNDTDVMVDQDIPVGKRAQLGKVMCCKYFRQYTQLSNLFAHKP